MATLRGGVFIPNKINVTGDSYLPFLAVLALLSLANFNIEYFAPECLFGGGKRRGRVVDLFKFVAPPTFSCEK